VARRQGVGYENPLPAQSQAAPEPRSPMRAALTFLSLLFAAALPVAAQNSVTGIRNLVFGTVFPGVSKVVLRTDAVNSGQFNLRGRRNGIVLLTFTLPASMLGPLGATLPLAFGANDAGFSPTQAVGNQTVSWDPRTPRNVTLSNTNPGRGSVFLGGRANPAVNQRAGNYTGTVTLSAVFF
jgi:hypothetical protein